MLGHMVLKVLAQEKEWEVMGVSSKDFDAERFTETESPDLRRLGLLTLADYVINCIGVLASGTDVEQMIRINALFPHELAHATSAKIIHMSTDGVFSGKGGPYDESSPPDADDAYGKSKLEGEVDALNVLNIRTSIIGPSPNKKNGLLEWLSLQPDGSTVKGYTNHVWNGVTTLQFAQLCAKIIKEDAFDRLRAQSHVLHFSPNKPVTKYELLELFKKVFGKNVNVERVEDPRGSVERVLNTKYEGIKKLFPHGDTMAEALKQLSRFSPPYLKGRREKKI